jgi:hypothetical protein
LIDNLQRGRRWKIKELTTLSASEPIKALKNPQRNLNPGTKAAAIPKIIAFNTNRNRPKVISMKGKVKKPNIGRKMAFSTPKTAAEIAAFPKLSISTPIGSREIIRKLIVVTNQLAISPAIAETPYFNGLTAGAINSLFSVSETNVTNFSSPFLLPV